MSTKPTSHMAKTVARLACLICAETDVRVTGFDRRNARVLWNYNILEEHWTAQGDFILALGSHDLRVAAHAARLFLNGTSRLLVISGGLGKVTRGIWIQPEAQKFSELAVAMGVPAANILTETAATNTGDNILLSRRLLAERRINVKTGVLVTKPYTNRRAYAAATKQWNSVVWAVAAPELNYDNYSNNEVIEERMINLMVGDTQRLTLYANQGFQIPQNIPKPVNAAYRALVERGFTEFMIR